jgi:putative DNA primase/helicase
MFPAQALTFTPLAAREPCRWRYLSGKATPLVATHLDAALAYAERGWPVFPMSQAKRPFTEHGLHDATTDAAAIRQWWGRWPDALPALATGKSSGVIALDVDIRLAGSGTDSLGELGVIAHPVAPTAHSPSGGYHIFFVAPAHELRSSTAKLGPFLDVRAEGGSIILPPGPGRFWDPVLNLETVPLAPMPEWMFVREVVRPPPVPPPLRHAGQLCLYGEVALDNAVKRIISAPAGEQESTLNREVFSIAQLSSGGVIPADLALDALRLAAQHMPSLDTRRPWRANELERKVQAAFIDGLRQPKSVPHGRR